MKWQLNSKADGKNTRLNLVKQVCNEGGFVSVMLSLERIESPSWFYLQRKAGQREIKEDYHCKKIISL